MNQSPDHPGEDRNVGVGGQEAAGQADWEDAMLPYPNWHFPGEQEGITGLCSSLTCRGWKERLQPPATGPAVKSLISQTLVVTSLKWGCFQED